MPDRNRRLAWLVCAAIALAFLFSVAFIAVEADHHCIGEGCRICLEIQACATLLKGAGAAYLAAAVLVFAFAVFALPRPDVSAGASSATLVSLKVRLSN